MITRESLLAVLDGRPLTPGTHAPRSGACVMEAIAWAAGEGWTDMPRCVARTAARVGQRANDAPIWRNDADRTERLLQYAVAVAGHAGREEAIATAFWRVALPILFRRAAWRCESETLAKHAEILAVDPSQENRAAAYAAAYAYAYADDAAAAAYADDASYASYAAAYAAAYAAYADDDAYAAAAAARREVYELILGAIERECGGVSGV